VSELYHARYLYFPQRPYARECTLYQNISQSQLEVNHHNTTNPIRCEKLAKTPPNLAPATGVIVRKFFNRFVGSPLLLPLITGEFQPLLLLLKDG